MGGGSWGWECKQVAEGIHLVGCWASEGVYVGGCSLSEGWVGESERIEGLGSVRMEWGKSIRKNKS